MEVVLTMEQVERAAPSRSFAEALDEVAGPARSPRQAVQDRGDPGPFGMRHALGARSLYAIALWGRDPSPEMARALGLGKGTTCVATLHLLFKRPCAMAPSA